MYHRREGKIWKEFDDLICASRYMIMDLRYATRVKKPAGFINGYPISEEIEHMEKPIEYHPYSREIARNVGGKNRR